MKLTRKFKRQELEELAHLREQSSVKETVRVCLESSALATAARACDLAGVSTQAALVTCLREIASATPLGQELLRATAKRAATQDIDELSSDIFDQIERARVKM